MASGFEAIATVEVGSGGAAVEFTSIPQTYTDLCLMLSARASITTGNIKFAPNGSAANRSARYLLGLGNSTESGASSSQPFIYSYAVPSSYTGSTFGNISYYIPNYTDSSEKTVSVDGVTENNGTTAFAFFSTSLLGTSAITSIELTIYFGGNFQQYSTATLYGISSS